MLLATLQTLLATPQHIAQFIIAKLKPLRQLQRFQELIQQLANNLLEFLPQRTLALAELLKRFLCHVSEQLINSSPAVPLVTLCFSSILDSIINKRTPRFCINALLQITTQMLVNLIKELIIMLLAHKFAKPLVCHSLVHHRCSHILHITIVRQDNHNLTSPHIIPALRVAFASLYLSIRMRNIFHILHNLDRSVQLVRQLNSFITHSLSIM